jgi:hypothetical protein
MAPPRKPKAEQLRARLKAMEAQLAKVEQSEHEEILRTLGENERAYIEIKTRRIEYLKKVLAMPAGQRPPVPEMTAATGLSKARLYQVKDGK